MSEETERQKRVREAQEHIEEATFALVNLKEYLAREDGAREAAIAFTHLETAGLWLGAAYQAVSEAARL